MIYLLCRILAYLLFKIFFRFRIYGRENIPAKGAFIIASNHKSHFDPPVISAASPRILYFMAKSELFRNKYFAWLIKGCNAFPVKRGMKGFEAINKAVGILQKGNAILIFPEGTRADNDKIRRGRIGTGLLACKAKAGIIPAYIKGSEEILPKGSRFIKFKPVSVYFGKMIEDGKYSDFENEDELKEEARKIVDKVMDSIKQLKELSYKSKVTN